jgi:hypothetical protein
MSNTAAEFTMNWANASGDPIDGQLNIDANKIYYNGDWKDIAEPAHQHNHNINQPAFFTYNDDDVKLNKIIDVIDEMLTALQPVINISSMKKIAKKLEGLRNAANQWQTYNLQPTIDETYDNYEEKIKLEEDLFEI